jgi:hypothetical protein
MKFARSFLLFLVSVYLAIMACLVLAVVGRVLSVIGDTL